MDYYGAPHSWAPRNNVMTSMDLLLVAMCVGGIEGLGLKCQPCWLPEDSSSTDQGKGEAGIIFLAKELLLCLRNLRHSSGQG